MLTVDGTMERQVIQEFLSIYQEARPLWDIKNELYHNRNAKNVEIQKLVEVLKKIEPEANDKTVLSKIRNLRNAFHKEHKKVRVLLLSLAKVFPQKATHTKILSYSRVEIQGRNYHMTSARNGPIKHSFAMIAYRAVPDL